MEEFQNMTRNELINLIIDLRKDNEYLKERIDTVLKNVFPEK
jgi:hypothetical protein